MLSWGKSTEWTPVVHPGPPSGKEVREILETVHGDRWQGEEVLREVKENQKFGPRGQYTGTLAETGETKEMTLTISPYATRAPHAGSYSFPSRVEQDQGASSDCSN